MNDNLLPAAAVTSGVSVTPVRLFQEAFDSLSSEVTTNVDTSSALPTSNGVNLSGTDTQWPFSTDLNLTPSSGLFTISSRVVAELFSYDPATRTYHPVRAPGTNSIVMADRPEASRARENARTPGLGRTLGGHNAVLSARPPGLNPEQDERDLLINQLESDNARLQQQMMEVIEKEKASAQRAAELEHAWHERSTPTDLPPFHPNVWVRDRDRGVRLRSEAHAEQSVSSTVRSRDRARDADRTRNSEGSRSQTRGDRDRQNRRSISQPPPDINEIPARTEPLASTRAEVATREERGRRRDRSRRDAETDNSLATKIEKMQEEIKRLRRADQHDTAPVDPMDNLSTLFLSNFHTRQRTAKSKTYLSTIKQDWNETVENYTKRFNNTCLEVDGLEDEEAIRMYMEGLQECRFFWVLWENPPTSLKSLFDKAQRYIEAERVQSLKQRSTIGNRFGRDNPKEVNRDNKGSPSRRSPNRKDRDRKGYGDPHPCHQGGRSDGSRIRRRKNSKC
ncbi:Retrotransposon gag protein [Corchorus olitorius]|uniref:Retrotransposon gag protein n=1 Tax=Corchorus olitorius TaxID=93759 RepID=A0A1R3GHZ6_9ROSI|nr:Retrotransposon gag protein [Corchorus olitorius]